MKIEVLGPPPTSGTRDSFVELYMEAGCRTFAWLNALRAQDEPRFKRACDTVREDGGYVEAGENDNLIVQKLTANKDAVGIFGYSFLEENLDKLKGAVVDGVSPTYETVSSGKYPASRPLFIYVKKQHVNVIPGIAEFVAEYTSEKALGEEGYLADKGLGAAAQERDRQDSRRRECNEAFQALKTHRAHFVKTNVTPKQLEKNHDTQTTLPGRRQRHRGRGRPRAAAGVRAERRHRRTQGAARRALGEDRAAREVSGTNQEDGR